MKIPLPSMILPFLLLPLIIARKALKQPHIVLIVADDLGYNDVPWHNPTIISPHLQDLAKAGVILEQNYVQPKCSPSRAALMTGKSWQNNQQRLQFVVFLGHYPFHTGRQHESLPPQMPTGLSTNTNYYLRGCKKLGTRHMQWASGTWDFVIGTIRQLEEGSGYFLGFIPMGQIITRDRLVIVRKCSRDMT